LPNQSRAPQRRQKIPLDGVALFVRDGRPGDKHKVDGLSQLSAVEPECFAQQSPGPVSGDGIADLLAGNNSKSGGRSRGQAAPIGYEATDREPLSVLSQLIEVA
jgi:hypothetical protein